MNESTNTNTKLGELALKSDELTANYNELKTKLVEIANAIDASEDGLIKDGLRLMMTATEQEYDETANMLRIVSCQQLIETNKEVFDLAEDLGMTILLPKSKSKNKVKSRSGSVRAAAVKAVTANDVAFDSPAKLYDSYESEFKSWAGDRVSEKGNYSNKDIRVNTLFREFTESQNIAVTIDTAEGEWTNS